MTPVVSSLVSLLALAAAIEAKPLTPPGHHAPPGVADLLSHARRGLQNLRRYYGDAHGLVRVFETLGEEMLTA